MKSITLKYNNYNQTSLPKRMANPHDFNYLYRMVEQALRPDSSQAVSQATRRSDANT